jgi:hypothetical protein
MGLGAASEADGYSSGDTMLEPAPEQAGQRFKHYELITGADGKPSRWVGCEQGVFNNGKTRSWRQPKFGTGTNLGNP